jgi:hypothetical protein
MSAKLVRLSYQMVHAKTALLTLYQLMLKAQMANVDKFANALTVQQLKLFLKMEVVTHAHLGLSHQRTEKYVDQVFVQHEKNC